MNVETYERQAAADYADFAATVSEILKAAIQQNPVALRLQQVQYRAKDVDSLRKKLEKLSAVESLQIQDIVKDLAGCRLIFYTNSDVSQFLSSHIVNDNFEIDWDRTKFHHPIQNPAGAAELFRGINYVVRLGDKRVALPEYARFSGMLCEIQVQTTLNHAWSEMAHDTIYKKPALTGFGGALMDAIEKSMKSIMQDYLVPAGYEFQKVLNDFERLSLGKELFDQGALDVLVRCEDNNTLYDLLTRLDSYVLPNYDDLESIQAEIRKAVVGVVEKARSRATQSIETPFGVIPGHSIMQITNVAANILDHLRYLNEEAVEGTFDSFCQLYGGANNDDERKRLLQSVGELAKYELRVWNAVGPLVQYLLLERVRKFAVDDRKRLRPVVIEVVGQVLSSQVTGTSSTYNTVTFHQGAVVPSDMLKDVRSRALAILKDYFWEADSDAERRIVAQQMNTATMTPHVGEYSNALKCIVLENSAEIIEFFAEISGNVSYELLQEFEHSALWLYRYNRKLPDDMESDSQLTAAQQRLLKSILTFRDQINQNRDFVVYKTLVGYQSVFPPAWEDDDFEVGAIDSYRNEEIGKLVEEVSADSANEWYVVIGRCVETESKDMATFPSLGRFLEELGYKKPQVVIGYLERVTDRLANFLPAMLGGLEKSGNVGFVNETIKQWIANGKFLRHIAAHLRFSTAFEPSTLARVLKASIAGHDVAAVLVAIETVGARYDSGLESLIVDVLLPALDYLTAKQDTRWANVVWYQPKAKKLVQDLKPEQIEVLLSNLVLRQSIDYQVEAVLKWIAEKYPTHVVDFFGKRLRHEPKIEDGSRYEAVPYRFHKLDVPLQAAAEHLIQRAHEWFEKDEDLFIYRGGRLVSIVFPEFAPQLEGALLKLLETKDKNEANLRFVVKVVRSYHHGGVFLLNLSKRLVELLPENDDLLGEIEGVLDATGVVRGEFGLVEAYKLKKSELDPWLNDPCEKVRSFAARHIAQLDRRIAFEQRRAEEDLEMRKRDYGEAGNGGSSKG